MPKRLQIFAPEFFAPFPDVADAELWDEQQEFQHRSNMRGRVLSTILPPTDEELRMMKKRGLSLVGLEEMWGGDNGEFVLEEENFEDAVKTIVDAIYTAKGKLSDAEAFTAHNSKTQKTQFQKALRSLQEVDAIVNELESSKSESIGCCEYYTFSCATLNALLGNTTAATKGYKRLLDGYSPALSEYSWPDWDTVLRIMGAVNYGVCLLNRNIKPSQKKSLSYLEPFRIPSPENEDYDSDSPDMVLYALATSNLAYAYLHGYGVTPDPVKAIELYLDAGHLFPKASYNLGVICFKGSNQTPGIPRNYEKAVEFFSAAADHNVPGADQALEQARNKRRIARLLPSERRDSATRQNMSDGKRNVLGLVPLQVDVKSYQSDYDAIAKWTLYQLGVLYESDTDLRRKFCLDLGYLHTYGMGVKKNRKTAIKYYETALELGSSNALLSLASLAIDKSSQFGNIKSYAYLLLAQERGRDTAGKQIEVLEILMKATEIEKAKTLVIQLKENLGANN